MQSARKPLSTSLIQTSLSAQQQNPDQHATHDCANRANLTTAEIMHEVTTRLAFISSEINAIVAALDAAHQANKNQSTWNQSSQAHSLASSFRSIRKDLVEQRHCQNISINHRCQKLKEITPDSAIRARIDKIMTSFRECKELLNHESIKRELIAEHKQNQESNKAENAEADRREQCGDHTLNFIARLR